jgi:hypothetical protein
MVDTEEPEMATATDTQTGMITLGCVDVAFVTITPLGKRTGTVIRNASAHSPT